MPFKRSPVNKPHELLNISDILPLNHILLNMPPTTSKPAPKRKPPTFKPPRPAANPKSTKQPPAPRRKSAPTKSKRPSFIADEASASEEEEEEDNNDDDDDDDDDEIPSDDAMPIDASSPNASQISDPALPSTSTQDPPQTIPPALLTKLLHHHFKGERTRIGKEADGVVGKYMETFVREAVARAAFERAESGKEGGGGGWSGGFLEVSWLKGVGVGMLGVVGCGLMCW